MKDLLQKKKMKLLQKMKKKGEKILGSNTQQVDNEAKTNDASGQEQINSTSNVMQNDEEVIHCAFCQE